MIKRFHALYVGQIELDNIGLNGTPANDRRYPASPAASAATPCSTAISTGCWRCGSCST